jgi:hypothetical protein
MPVNREAGVLHGVSAGLFQRRDDISACPIFLAGFTRQKWIVTFLKTYDRTKRDAGV